MELFVEAIKEDASLPEAKAAAFFLCFWSRGSATYSCHRVSGIEYWFHEGEKTAVIHIVKDFYHDDQDVYNQDFSSLSGASSGLVLLFSVSSQNISIVTASPNERLPPQRKETPSYDKNLFLLAVSALS